MADEKEAAGNPYEPVLLIVGLLAVLGVLWWMQGGPQKGVPKNMFLAPTVTTPQNDVQYDTNQDIGGQ